MKHHKKNTFFLLFLGLCLFGCSASETNENTPKKYFNVIQFIENQSEILQKQNPTITKTIVSNEENVKKSVQIENWESELKIFSECDINIPILLDAYQIEETFEKTIYTAKNASAKVQKMTIEKSGEKITALRMHYRNVSNLFHTDRFPEMELENGKLKRYSVRGFQKIQLKDKNSFEITGVLP